MREAVWDYFFGKAKSGSEKGRWLDQEESETPGDFFERPNK